MSAILRLLAAGVPAAKIIAKYGKKAYKAAKEQLKQLDKVDKATGDKPSTKFLLGAGTLNLAAMALIKPIDKYLTKKKEENLRSSKDKKFKGHTRYKK